MLGALIVANYNNLNFDHEAFKGTFSPWTSLPTILRSASGVSDI